MCSLLDYRSTTEFCVFTLYLKTPLNSLFSSRSFCRFPEIFYVDYRAIWNWNSFISSFPICINFISFSCLIALSRSPSTVVLCWIDHIYFYLTNSYFLLFCSKHFTNINSFNPHNNPESVTIVLSFLFYTWGNWGSKRLSNLPYSYLQLCKNYPQGLPWWSSS